MLHAPAQLGLEPARLLSVESLSKSEVSCILDRDIDERFIGWLATVRKADQASPELKLMALLRIYSLAIFACLASCDWAALCARCHAAV